MGAQVICPTNFEHIRRNSMPGRESVKGWMRPGNKNQLNTKDTKYTPFVPRTSTARRCETAKVEKLFLRVPLRPLCLNSRLTGDIIRTDLISLGVKDELCKCKSPRR